LRQPTFPSLNFEEGNFPPSGYSPRRCL
jgi:hypothetical protein